MPTCYVLRHVPFESLGLIEPLLVERSMAIQIVDVPVTELPNEALRDAELLVVLGGPISVYEEHLYPFLTDELRIIETRLAQHKPTLGICLGAQLMAKALGARVYPGKAKEIGWSKLMLSPEGMRHALAEVSDQRVLHWHGDTFDLPEGARLLASTELTPHQAFAWQDAAIALQFHLEVTAHDLEGWYVGHTAELSAWGKMSVPELRAEGQQYAPRLAPHATRALRAMLDNGRH